MSLNGSDLSAGANKTSFGDTGITVNNDDTIDVEVDGVTSEITDILAHPETEASYIIWTDETTIYAKNGVTGQIDYSGVDATTVIQAAINQCDTMGVGEQTGGIIFIKSGIYIINNAITLGSYVNIKGSGRGRTILQLASGANCNMFEKTTGLLWLGQIIGVTLDGRKSTQASGSAIYIPSSVDVYDLRFIDLFIYRWKEYGIYIENIWNNDVDGCIIEYCDIAGIYLGGSDGKIRNTSFKYNYDAIKCSFKGTLTNCYFHANTHYCIDISGGPPYSTSIEIGDCNFKGVASQTSFIYISDAGHTDVDIHDCMFDIEGNVYCITSNGQKSLNIHDCVFDTKAYTINYGGTLSSAVTFTNIRPFTPYGTYTFLVHTTSNTISHKNNSNVITALQDYQVIITPAIISSTGGTDVSITIKDQDGNTLASGLTTLTLQYMPAGYKINWGNFSVQPTVIISGAN